MSLWLLARRNVGRNRRRTLLTAGIVGFGFAALTLAAGFMTQSFEALREGSIRGGTGHLQIATTAFFAGSEAETLEHGLHHADRVTALIARDPAVDQVLQRIDFFGLVSVGDRALPFVGAGLEPELEGRSMDTAKLVAQGRWLEGGSSYEVVLGAGLAATLGAKPGDVVSLFAITVDGVLNAVDAEVTGVVALPIRELDDRYLAAPLATAEELLGAAGTVSKLIVLVRDETRAREVAERVRETLAGHGIEIAVRTWEELAVFYRQVRYLYVGIFGFLGSVLLIIILLAAANSVLMATMERTREIGTLRALGMRPRLVARLFVLEGLIVGSLGCLGGAVFSLLLRELVNRVGIVLPPPPGVAHPVRLFVQLYADAYVAGAAGMLLAVLLAAWLPARRAARIPIIEALAHV